MKLFLFDAYFGYNGIAFAHANSKEDAIEAIMSQECFITKSLEESTRKLLKDSECEIINEDEKYGLIITGD